MINRIIETFKTIIDMIKKSLVNNALLTISFFIFFILFPSIYYLYTFKLFNIVHDYPIISIFMTLLLFFSCLTVILVKLDSKMTSSEFSPQIIYKLAYNIFYVGVLFVLFSLLFHISKFVVYNSTTASITVAFILVLLFLALKESSSSAFNSDEINDIKDDLFEILKNILFLIPCYIVDFIELVKKNISGLPNTSNILIILISIIIVSFYIFPILKDLAKNTNGITLVKNSKSLEKQVLYMSQKELKDKIIDSKQFAKRKLLRKNNDFKKYLERTSSSIPDLNKTKEIEGFDKNIHLLDKHITYEDEINNLTQAEKTLVQKEMEKNRISFDDFKSAEKFKEYILSLRQDKKYFEILNKIGEYNSKKNDFIYQEASSLVDLINRTNHIQDYNYHYGISFWVYFDTKIKQMRTTNNRGFIMTYSNTPKIFYDYGTKELKITVDDCENESKSCSENVIYRTTDILFQKWNHFVVNYNYGTMDCFINGNIVSTKDKVAPYIEDAFLEFGRSNEPLHNCGICNITYYDTPLNLNSINQIYRNRNIPCDV